MLIRGQHLRRGGQRDAPRAVVDLALEQGGAHRGLAVRCQLDVVRLHELLHPLQVVAHAGFVQHRHGQADIFVQQVPVQRGHTGRRTGLGERAQAFAVHIQQGGGGRGIGHGGRSSLENIYVKVCFFHYRERNLQAAARAYP
ncbi:hypothetical protein D9M71_669340 [compost metagenome]